MIQNKAIHYGQVAQLFINKISTDIDNNEDSFLHKIPNIKADCYFDADCLKPILSLWDGNNSSRTEIDDCMGEKHALNQVFDATRKAIDDWKELLELSPVFIDKRQSIRDIEMYMPYVLGCGYVAEGEIRETKIGSKTKGESKNHMSERVSKYGLFNNTIESVITGSSSKSEKTNSYSYWQVYKLKDKNNAY